MPRKSTEQPKGQEGSEQRYMQPLLGIPVPHICLLNPLEGDQRKVLNNVPSVLSKIMILTPAFMITEEIAREGQKHGAVQRHQCP